MALPTDDSAWLAMVRSFSFKPASSCSNGCINQALSPSPNTYAGRAMALAAEAGGSVLDVTSIGAVVSDAGLAAAGPAPTRRTLAPFSAFACALVGVLAFAFIAFAAALACLRACLAAFLACFKALRACLNWALARRARLRAASTCFSAAVAAARSREMALPFGILVVFIALFLTNRHRAGPHPLRAGPVPNCN